MREGRMRPCHYVGAEIPVLGTNAHWNEDSEYLVAEGLPLSKIQHHSFDRLFQKYSNQISRTALPVGVFQGWAAKSSIPPLTCTRFDPANHSRIPYPHVFLLFP